MPKRTRIRGEHLHLALNFLEYLTTFKEDSDGFKYAARFPPEKNDWDFTADYGRLNRILRDGFGRDADPEDPLDERGITGEWDLPSYYRGSCWSVYHRHLKDNLATFGSVEIDVTSLLDASTDVQDELMHVQDGLDDARAFTRFLRLLACGEFKECDLMALDTDEKI